MKTEAQIKKMLEEQEAKEYAQRRVFIEAKDYPAISVAEKKHLRTLYRIELLKEILE
jgi:hypothetical protein